MGLGAVVLGLVAAAMICLGSYALFATPDDGQTAMIAFPAWLFGAIIGSIALRMVLHWDVGALAKSVVLVFAAISASSVIGAFAYLSWHELTLQRKEPSAQGDDPPEATDVKP